MAKIKEGMQVKIEVPTHGRGIPIKTMSQGPLAGDIREYYREKVSQKSGRFLFGIVQKSWILDEKVDEETGDIIEPERGDALIKWAGPRYRTSVLSVKILTPAINYS